MLATYNTSKFPSALVLGIAKRNNQVAPLRLMHLDAEFVVVKSRLLAVEALLSKSHHQF
jgi:hypothetical protein